MINTAVILAGGRSSRMGEDKALLPFGGEKTLALFQYKRLSEYFDKIYISSKNDKFDADMNIIEDSISYISSPMVALQSILSYIDEEAVFVLGVDMPFVSKDIIQRLIERYEDNQNKIIVAQSSKGLEPLCAIYPVSILPVVKNLLDKKEHRLHTILSLTDIESVRFEDRNSFFNLNRFSDYEKARMMI